MYGNPETMGVVVDPLRRRPARQVGTIKASWWRMGGADRCTIWWSGEWSLPRGYYATSLFDLTPDTAYTIEVEYYDDEGRLISRMPRLCAPRLTRSSPRRRVHLCVTQGERSRPGDSELAVARCGRRGAMTPGTTLRLRRDLL
jgi:hypothetical protein